MNNMYDILARLDSVTDKPLTEGAAAPVVKTDSGFAATAPQGKKLQTTLPKDRPLNPQDVRVKEQMSNQQMLQQMASDMLKKSMRDTGMLDKEPDTSAKSTEPASAEPAASKPQKSMPGNVDPAKGPVDYGLGKANMQEAPEAGEFAHRGSPTFGHSHQMAPGFDPTFRSPIGSPAGSEIEELEYLMSKGAMTGAEEMRLRSLYNKFGIRSQEDLAKIPQLRQQELERIGKSQAELQRKSAEANVASRDEMERQRAARMGITQQPRSDISTTAGFRAALDKAGRPQPAVREDEELAEQAAFQFSPEQETWLGKSDRQDPYILARMPGPKPPIDYFVNPEDRAIAQRLNFGQQNLNRIKGLVGTKPGDAEVFATRPAASPQARPAATATDISSPAGFRKAYDQAAGQKSAAQTQTPPVVSTPSVPGKGPVATDKSLAPNERVVASGSTYRIQPGDTLSRIAAKNGTTVRAIMSANPQIQDANRIQAGAQLTLPAAPTTEAERISSLKKILEDIERPQQLDEVLPAMAALGGAAAQGARMAIPAIARGGASLASQAKTAAQNFMRGAKGEPARTAGGRFAAAGGATKAGQAVAKAGDIAKKNPLTVAGLAGAAGYELGGGGIGSAVADAVAAQKDAAPGATAGAYAGAGNAAWQKIYDLNRAVIGDNPNLIYPNQQLKMPDGSTYTVKPGDSLWKIAQAKRTAQSATQPGAGALPGKAVAGGGNIGDTPMAESKKIATAESRHGRRPDFPDIDRDGDRSEPISKAAQEMDEGSTGDYSAKKARAGKDIGKPGKTFAKIAKSAGERYGSKERGEKVAGAVLAKLRAKEDVNEDDVEEGNDFTKARLDAIRAGKPTFKLNGKTYRVTGDTSDEKRMDEGFADFFDKKQMYRKIGADVEGRSDDYVVTFRDGTRKRYQEMDGRRKVTSLEPVDAPEEQDDEGNVVKRSRGRPKGSKRSLGAKGPSGRSKLLRMEEDYDKDEYDEEGEMAKSQARTIEDAAQELQDILDDDQNLPEWVQKKIVLAKEYIDSARDYMKANPDEEQMDVDVEVDDEELVAEKAVSRAQRAAAGIAYAAKKGDIPKSELRGASKEMADMPEKELKKFAKTKEKGLPEKVKEEDKEEVDETTVSGSVAVSSDKPKAKKGGMQFGKGVYESQIAESLDRKLAVLTEGMNINMSVDETGKKSLTVSATDQEADQLAAILKMAGLGGGSSGSTCEVCGGHEGMHEAGCDRRDMVEEELANSPEPEYAELGDTRDYGVSGGLNGPKLQSNPNNPADNPLAMRSLASKGASGQLNLGAVAEDIEQKMQNRLMDLYKRIQ